MRWVDVAGRALRRTWIAHWHRQYVEVLPLAQAQQEATQQVSSKSGQSAKQQQQASQQEAFLKTSASDPRDNSAMSRPGETNAKRPRRRWYQYSLRTLLGLMTLAVGLVMAWRVYHPAPRGNVVVSHAPA